MTNDPIQEIKDRLSIVDVVAWYVSLQPSGKSLKGKSPFTNEKTPSFYVSPDKGMYYCFSSSQGGDIFTFVQKMEGVDFKGALKILAEKAGVELQAVDPKKRDRRDRQFEALEEATRFFTSKLADDEDAKAYLKERGLKPSTLALWRVGYAPGPPRYGWRLLYQELTKVGFTDDDLVSVGLVKKAGEGKEPYDHFRDRIMFPISDPGGRVVGYSGRILNSDSDAPKYVNSPETDLFNKSNTMFGYYQAKQGIRSLNFSLIVEGQFDVVLAHQAGYVNAVAVSGTALTENHVSLLQRLSNNVVLALDNDRAGLKASFRSSELMLKRGMDVKVALMPEGMDPADLINKDHSEFKRAIGQAKPVIEYILTHIENSSRDARACKLRVREELLPLVTLIPNVIDQEHFGAGIAERIGTTSEAVYIELRRIREQASGQKGNNDGVTNSAPEISTEAVLKQEKNNRYTVLIEYLSLCVEVLDEEIAVALRNVLVENFSIDSQVILQDMPLPKKSRQILLLERYLSNHDIKTVKNDLVDRLNELTVAIAKAELDNAKKELAQAEAENDQSAIEACLGKIAMAKSKSFGGSFDVGIFNNQ